MKSNEFLLEDGDLLLSLLPSNSVANYDHHTTSISNEQSTVNSLFITDTESVSREIPPSSGHDDIDLNLPQKSLRLSSPEISPPSGHDDNNLQSLIQVYFSFGDFSQSTACVATGFGDCSSTLLDKLWYLYLYIYRLISIIITCC